MEPELRPTHSLLVHAFSAFVEWGKKLSLSYWLFRDNHHIFAKIEALMMSLNFLLIFLLIGLEWIPWYLHPLLYLFFVQRVLEFVVVYSRNFIFKRGRIYAETHSSFDRGAWLMLMFSLSVMQIVLVFASSFRLLSLEDPRAFAQPLGVLDSIYFSTVTFLTIGYGDITPLTTAARLLAIIQGALTFYIVVIMINGLVSSHFGGAVVSELTKKQEEPK